jgi:hypothetical protein
MSENKCCGNCKHFKDERADGFGWCAKDSVLTGCGCSCHKHEYNYNGWAEITPDNVDLIYDGDIVIVTDGTYYNKASEWHLGIGTMAKHGGYYYYVLPELKID